MTGNSWARAAESKYEHGRRAREDRGARPPRTGWLPGLGGRQLPPPPNPPPSQPPRRCRPRARAKGGISPPGSIPLRGGGPRAEPSIPPRSHLRPLSRVEKRETTTGRPDSERRTRGKTLKSLRRLPLCPRSLESFGHGSMKRSGKYFCKCGRVRLQRHYQFCIQEE
ncbi:vasodilator-stimulated phosphoprotein-like [Lutra lutra]|uniref:vasodilator-stimulated phosphoprotein-like n=1 Tax=Lutra lutra TaxID=9657 RepID=UPI001FD39F3C|nr:vasodilator-stimulated phosphoprotein-like [Lutra lutra]